MRALKEGDLSGETFEGTCKRIGCRARFTVGNQVADIEDECNLLLMDGAIQHETLLCEMYSTFEIERIKEAYMNETSVDKIDEEELDEEGAVEFKFTGDISVLSWSSLSESPSSPPPKAESPKPEPKAKAKASPKKKAVKEVDPFEGMAEAFKTSRGRLQMLDTASRIVVSVKSGNEALYHQRKVFAQMGDEIDDYHQISYRHSCSSL